MKKYIFLTMLCLAVTSATAQIRKTLRIDYALTGDISQQEISVTDISTFDGWAGRVVNMDKNLLRGNGDIRMRDARTGCILYTQSFSTLFQEWLNTEEALNTRRSFEHVMLLPMPEDSVFIDMELRGNHDRVLCRLTHKVIPSDILIRKTEVRDLAPHKLMLGNGKPNGKINVVIVAEGYKKNETKKFYAHARQVVESLLNHEPFGSMKDRFNITAVALESKESGASIPKLGTWKNTALGSHYDTFYTDRYLTTQNVRLMHDLLTGIPYEHIIVLANTDYYGGGGIYNSYTLTTTGHPKFAPVVVHEFGHSFAGLADEYFYDDMFSEFYYPDTEPWEQNITTLKDFASKWEDMLPPNTPIPTPKRTADGKSFSIGVFEGGGYQSKGVYRPSDDCRMKTNEYETFCPVCQRAIKRLIDFYTVEAPLDPPQTKPHQTSTFGEASDAHE